MLICKKVLNLYIYLFICFLFCFSFTVTKTGNFLLFNVIRTIISNLTTTKVLWCSTTSNVRSLPVRHSGPTRVLGLTPLAEAVGLKKDEKKTDKATSLELCSSDFILPTFDSERILYSITDERRGSKTEQVVKWKLLMKNHLQQANHQKIKMNPWQRQRYFNSSCSLESKVWVRCSRF